MANLPEKFQELEPFIKWAIKTETGRKDMRLASTIEEINQYVEAMLPKMDDILEHLNAFPLEDMPEPERRLQLMTLSLAEVSTSYELYFQPTIPDALGFERLPPTDKTNEMYW